jgi:hypothetical protein
MGADAGVGQWLDPNQVPEAARRLLDMGAVPAIQSA